MRPYRVVLRMCPTFGRPAAGRLLTALSAAVVAVAFLMAGPGGAGAADRAATAQPIRQLTVATYNVHHCQGTDGVLDIDRVARNIAASHADIVGVEELDNHYSARSNFADEPARIAADLGYHYVFAANLDTPSSTPGQPNSQYGTAIFSRYPIVETTHVLLPKSPDQEQRGLVGAEIDVNGRQIWFYNTHLAASSQVDRQAQADTLKQLIDPTVAPTFLTGDLNAYEDDPEINTIDSFLSDLWPIAGHGTGYTFDSDDPKGRIDYIYASPGAVTPRLVRVSPIVPEASDHLLVAAIVAVP